MSSLAHTVTVEGYWKASPCTYTTNTLKKHVITTANISKTTLIEASMHYKTKNLVWVSFDLLRLHMVYDYSGKLSCMQLYLHATQKPMRRLFEKPVNFFVLFSYCSNIWCSTVNGQSKLKLCVFTRKHSVNGDRGLVNGSAWHPTAGSHDWVRLHNYRSTKLLSENHLI